ncbi:MAG: hypothetical protein HYU66_00210 [Armatimonadetes bacterium]|nr:hypothetical protein [Armatimonadota bacterium]
MAAEPGGDMLYVIQLLKRDGTALRRVRFEPDWASALEWAWFQGVRRHGAEFCQPGDGQVAPRWHPETGPPYLSGFDVTFAVNGGGEQHGLSIEYWKPLARALSSPLVKDGLLEAGETFT